VSNGSSKRNPDERSEIRVFVGQQFRMSLRSSGLLAATLAIQHLQASALIKEARLCFLRERFHSLFRKGSLKSP
jgi:hypothetical protein